MPQAVINGSTKTPRRYRLPLRHAIAHGYLTLSLYPALRNLVNADQPILEGVKNVINYGLNKVRFPNALKVGARVRARYIGGG